MKITIVVDKVGSAIYKLAEAVKVNNEHLNICICDVHPKRPSEEQIRKVANSIRDSDIVDIHYWKSGEVIKDFIKDKKKILFHFNPYDLDKNKWDEYDYIVVGNQEMREKLPRAKLISYGIDLDFYAFNDEYKHEKSVLMVANRIESSKGIIEVAIACKKGGYKFNLVGNISDGTYFQSLMALKDDNFDIVFYENISNEELRELYYKSGIFVCNSKDNFESGTLPILEAMACGTPVLTRNIGHVPDLYSENMMINLEPKENVDYIKEKLDEMYNNYNLLIKYRSKAWQTVKNRYDKKMARQIGRLYYSLIGTPFISIIIPTFDRPKILVESLMSALQQDYKYKEVIVIDSGNTDVKDVIIEARKKFNTPIRYIRFENKGEFTLPKARNMGIMESQGDYLLFCDDRIKMNTNAVSEFAKHIGFKTWLYGMKDEAKKDFIENFSFISRLDLISNGMFNERIDRYGGQSEELRKRFGNNGFIFELVHGALARSISKSSSRFNKKKDIIASKFNIFKLYENY